MPAPYHHAYSPIMVALPDTAVAYLKLERTSPSSGLNAVEVEAEVLHKGFELNIQRHVCALLMPNEPSLLYRLYVNGELQGTYLATRSAADSPKHNDITKHVGRFATDLKQLYHYSGYPATAPVLSNGAVTHNGQLLQRGIHNLPYQCQPQVSVKRYSIRWSGYTCQLQQLQQVYELRVTAGQGGSAWVNTKGTVLVQVAEGKAVQLTAVAAEGYTFDAWYSNGQPLFAGMPVVHYSPTSSGELEARFTKQVEPPKKMLTVNLDGLTGFGYSVQLTVSVDHGAQQSFSLHTNHNPYMEFEFTDFIDVQLVTETNLIGAEVLANAEAVFSSYSAVPAHTTLLSEKFCEATAITVKQI